MLHFFLKFFISISNPFFLLFSFFKNIFFFGCLILRFLFNNSQPPPAVVASLLRFDRLTVINYRKPVQSNDLPSALFRYGTILKPSAAPRIGDVFALLLVADDAKFCEEEEAGAAATAAAEPADLAAGRARRVVDDSSSPGVSEVTAGAGEDDGPRREREEQLQALPPLPPPPPTPTTAEAEGAASSGADVEAATATAFEICAFVNAHNLCTAHSLVNAIGATTTFKKLDEMLLQAEVEWRAESARLRRHTHTGGVRRAKPWREVVEDNLVWLPALRAELARASRISVGQVVPFDDVDLRRGGRDSNLDKWIALSALPRQLWHTPPQQSLDGAGGDAVALKPTSPSDVLDVIVSCAGLPLAKQFVGAVFAGACDWHVHCRLRGDCCVLDRDLAASGAVPSSAAVSFVADSVSQQHGIETIQSGVRHWMNSSEAAVRRGSVLACQCQPMSLGEAISRTGPHGERQRDCYASPLIPIADPEARPPVLAVRVERNVEGRFDDSFVVTDLQVCLDVEAAVVHLDSSADDGSNSGDQQQLDDDERDSSVSSSVATYTAHQLRYDLKAVILFKQPPPTRRARSSSESVSGGDVGHYIAALCIDRSAGRFVIVDDVGQVPLGGVRDADGERLVSLPDMARAGYVVTELFYVDRDVQLPTTTSAGASLAAGAAGLLHKLASAGRKGNALAKVGDRRTPLTAVRNDVARDVFVSDLERDSLEYDSSRKRQAQQRERELASSILLPLFSYASREFSPFGILSCGDLAQIGARGVWINDKAIASALAVLSLESFCGTWARTCDEQRKKLFEMRNIVVGLYGFRPVLPELVLARIVEMVFLLECESDEQFSECEKLFLEGGGARWQIYQLVNAVRCVAIEHDEELVGHNMSSGFPRKPDMSAITSGVLTLDSQNYKALLANKNGNAAFFNKKLRSVWPGAASIAYLLSARVLIVTVHNDAAQHWYLGVLDVHTRQVRWYDSLDMSDDSVLHAQYFASFAEYILELAHAFHYDDTANAAEKCKVELLLMKNEPKQRNFNDCGAFVIAHAINEAIPRTQRRFAIDPEAMHDGTQRYAIALELLRSAMKRRKLFEAHRGGAADAVKAVRDEQKRNEKRLRERASDGAREALDQLLTKTAKPAPPKAQPRKRKHRN